MISAKEACELSRKNSGIAEELKKIESEICKAAMLGKTEIVYKPDVQLCKALFLQLEKPLRDLGFSVAWFNKLNRLLIRW